MLFISAPIVFAATIYQEVIVNAGLVQEVNRSHRSQNVYSYHKILSIFKSRDEEDLNYGVLGGLKCTVSYETLMTQR